MTGNQDIKKGCSLNDQVVCFNDISYQFGRGGGGCGDWASNCA